MSILDNSRDIHGTVSTKERLINDRKNKIENLNKKIASVQKNQTLSDDDKRFIARCQETIQAYRFDIKMAQAYIDHENEKTAHIFGQYGNQK